MWELEHPQQEREKEKLLKADREAKASDALKNSLGASAATSGKFSSTLGGTYNSGKPKKANDEIVEFLKELDKHYTK